MYNIKWSEDIDPQLTEEQKEQYRELGMEQIYPIGNTVKERRLFHGIGDKETIDKMLKLISFKNPKVISVKDVDGIDYGYEKVYDEKNDEDSIVAIEGMTPYKKQDDTDFFQEIDVEIDGEIVKIKPADHKFAGWE